MRTPNGQLGVALSMFYEGLSLAEISQELGRAYNNPVNTSSVQRWVIKYTRQAIESLETIQVQASKTWLVDETVVKICGQDVWLWDVIDYDNRFLLASHLSGIRAASSVEKVIRRAFEKSDIAPRSILLNSRVVAPTRIARNFGTECLSLQSPALTANINSSRIKRIQVSLRPRITMIHKLKSLEMAELALNGFLIHYNFFRSSKTAKDKTPAVMAGVSSDYKSWLDVLAASGKVRRRLC